MIADFADAQEGGFFFTAGDHESLLARPKDPYDGALPSANSMAVLDLMALHRATGEASLSRPGREDPRGVQHVRSRRIPRPCRSCSWGSRSISTPGPVPTGSSPGPLGEGALAPVPAKVVTATARLAEKQQPAPGREVEAVVSLDIKEGWHLYANPTGVEILKPTTLVLEPARPSRRSRSSYPKGQAKVLGSLGKEEVRLYEGKIDIPVRLTLAEDAVPGKIDAAAQAEVPGLRRQGLPGPGEPDHPAGIHDRHAEAARENKP